MKWTPNRISLRGAGAPSFGLDAEIRGIVEVVEHGLFLGIANEVIVASGDGITALTRRRQ